MALVSTPIPNLLNGVSQQAASQRLATQGAAQENAYSSIVEGLKKRAPTHYVAKLVTGQLDEAFIHTINRDTEERYVAIITDGEIKVFDLEGTQQTLQVATGAADYISNAHPKTAFRAVTIADFTFILNREVEVAMDEDDLTDPDEGIAVIHVRQGNYSTDYKVYIDNAEVASYTTHASNADTIKTTTIASELFSDLTTALNLTAAAPPWGGVLIGNVIVLRKYKADGAGLPFMLRAVDSNGDRNIIAFRDQLQKFTDLPNTGRESHVVKISGDKTTELDDYYVKFTPDPDANAKETIQRGVGLSAEFAAMSLTINQRIEHAYEGLLGRISTNDEEAAWLTLLGSSGDATWHARLIAGIADSTEAETYRDAHTLNEVIQNAYQGFLDRAATSNEVEDWQEGQIGRGVWLESAAYGIGKVFDATTMPHVLVRLSNGTWSFGPAGHDPAGVDDVIPGWGERAAGDETSNPDPSFVGSTISDMVFYRNRLALLTDDNMVASRAGEYFNFFRSTVTTLLDDEPIDTAAPHTKVSILKHAIAFDKLLLFADQTQFVLDPGELFTPKSASISVATEFESSPDMRPIVAGKNVYFAVPKGQFVGMREFYVDKQTETEDAADITSHVPSYIPTGVFKAASATNEDVFIVLTDGDPTRVYVYKYYWRENDKLQSSWSRWSFCATVLNADFINTDLYLVLQREDGVYLERMGVEPDRKDDGFDFEFLLDQRVSTAAGQVTVSYSPGDNRTTFQLPYEASAGDCAPLQVVSASEVSGRAALTFFGEDTGLGESDRLPSHPISDVARDEFFENLTGDVGTEDFESFDDDTLAPIPLNFPGAGTALLQGSGRVNEVPTDTNGTGRYPISGDKYYESSSTFTIQFSDPIVALGFYAVDVGDFNGQLTVTFGDGTSSRTVVVPHTLNSPGGGVIYFGYIDRDNPFTQVTFGNTTGSGVADAFGFDDMTIAVESQLDLAESEGGQSLPAGTLVPIEYDEDDATTVTAVGNWSGGSYIVGRRYEARYRFSTLTVKEKDDRGDSVVASARLQIKRMWLVYDRTGYFRVEVTPRHGSTYVYPFTGVIVGESNLGEISLGSGEFSFPVRSKSDRVIIEIVNDSPLPMRIQSAEFEAELTLRSQRL